MFKNAQVLKGALVRSITTFLLFTVVCGLVFTLVVTGIAQLAFPRQANGSIIVGDDGVAWGSEHVGQRFTDDGHLWGRPMSYDVNTYTTPDGDIAVYAGPTNASPATPAYGEEVEERARQIAERNPDAPSDQVPVDLVTTSGSGLDPDISPEAAAYQVPRIAKARGIGEDEVQAAIDACTTGRFLGVFGEPTVNVLKVNLLLDGKLATE